MLNAFSPYSTTSNNSPNGIIPNNFAYPSTQKNNFTIYYHNTSGIRTKSSSFQTRVPMHEFDIIALTETWLCDTILSSEYFDDFYNVFRYDRSRDATGFNMGGGVLLAVRQDFNCKQINLHISDNILEQLCILVSFNSNKSIYFIISHIPPNSPIELYDMHLKNINYISENCTDSQEICVLGDYNLCNIIWSFEDKILLPFNIKSDLESMVIGYFLSNELQQINYCKNDIGRILDLIFIVKFV